MIYVLHDDIGAWDAVLNSFESQSEMTDYYGGKAPGEVISNRSDLQSMKTKYRHNDEVLPHLNAVDVESLGD